MAEGYKVVAQNKKARHDYEIEETYEAGIVLTGTEIKSIRAGKVNLKDSYARIKDGEVFLLNAYHRQLEQATGLTIIRYAGGRCCFIKKEINKLIGLPKRRSIC